MIRGLFAAVAAVAFVGGVDAARAELAAWDQARVTKYAQELVTATEDLEQSLKKIGIQNIAQQNAMYKVRDTVSLLNTASKGLARSLAKGSGREETFPRYQRVEAMRRDAEVQARRADIPEQVFEKVFKVGGALQRLRPYYVAEAEPETKPEE